jgi:hypothetical protein
MHGYDHRPRGPDPAFHPVRNLKVVFNGGGLALVGGEQQDASVDYMGEITQWTLLADVPGNAVVDIWKDDFGSYPPTLADTITAASQPTLSATDHASDDTLPSWIRDVAAGDCFRFTIDSISAITRLTVIVKIQPLFDPAISPAV